MIEKHSIVLYQPSTRYFLEDESLIIVKLTQIVENYFDYQRKLPVFDKGYVSADKFRIKDETMCSNLCSISDEIKEKMKKFRFRRAKDNAAIILKINMKTMEVCHFYHSVVDYSSDLA